MSKDIFRLATVEDAPELLKLVNSAFQPIRRLDIDWPSTRADIHMVSENIENHSAVVLERDGKLISTITIRFPWESETLLQNIRLFGGLRRFRNIKGRAPEASR